MISVSNLQTVYSVLQFAFYTADVDIQLLCRRQLSLSWANLISTHAVCTQLFILSVRVYFVGKTIWYSFSAYSVNALTLVVGNQEEHLACKNWVIGVIICLQLSACIKVQIICTRTHQNKYMYRLKHTVYSQVSWTARWGTFLYQQCTSLTFSTAQEAGYCCWTDSIKETMPPKWDQQRENETSG